MDVAVDSGAARGVERSRFRKARAPIVLAALSLAVFAGIQVALTYRIFARQHADWVSGRFPATAFFPGVRAVLEHPSWVPVWLRFPYGRGWEASTLVRFAALMAVVAAAAAWGRRWTFWVPVVVWAVGPWLFGISTSSLTTAPHQAPPFTLSIYWPPSIVWLGMTVEVMLVCIPGVVVAARRPASVRQSSDPALEAATFTLCVAIFVLWQSTAATASGNAGATWTADLARVLPLFVLGVLLPFSRRTLVVLAGAVALFWWFWQVQVVVAPIRLIPISALLGGLAPFAFAALLGAAWQPLAAGLARLRSRPWTLFWIANALNVADAIMTWAFLRTGQIAEFNPVVRGIGLPAKVILVGTLTWVLMKTRPRALVWPILVLAFVMAWDVAGIALGRAMGLG